MGLHLTAFFGLHKVIGSLADIYGLDVQDNSGKTLVAYAIENGQVGMVELFSERGDLVESIVRGIPLLSHAIDSGHDAVVRLLIEKGADIEPKDNDGRAPLSHATVMGGSNAIVSLFLE